MKTGVAQASNRRSAKAPMSRLGKLFVAVLLIAVFEGALRKWLSSSLTFPLVLARDGLALYAIWHAIRYDLVSTNRLSFKLLLMWTCLVIAWGMAQTLLSQTSPVLLALGLRYWLLYLWFGYVAALGMQREDFRRSTMVMVYLLIAMTPLVMLQQASSPDAFINTQIDTDERDIFTVVAGVVRTTGTFSFTLGFTTFIALAIPLAMSLKKIALPGPRIRIVFLLAFACALVCSLLSGSRAAIINYGVMLAVYLLGSIWFARGRSKMYALAALLATIALLAIAGAVFHDAIEVTQQRFSDAADVEDFSSRVLTIFIGEPDIYQRFSWLGYGLGASSNFAGYLQSGERGGFALGEAESGRILLEGGLLGILFIALKLAVIVAGLRKAWRVSAINGSPGPLLMWLTIAVALMTWSTIGQLTVNVLVGVLLAFGILMLRFPAAVVLRRRLVPRRPPPRSVSNAVLPADVLHVGAS